ncbi:unnamed protein product, partial [Staurois parvus]
MGHYSYLEYKEWSTIPPNDTKNRALFLPLKPMMGHSLLSMTPNDGGCSLREPITLSLTDIMI